MKQQRLALASGQLPTPASPFPWPLLTTVSSFLGSLHLPIKLRASPGHLCLPILWEFLDPRLWETGQPW